MCERSDFVSDNTSKIEIPGDPGDFVRGIEIPGIPGNFEAPDMVQYSKSWERLSESEAPAAGQQPSEGHD